MTDFILGRPLLKSIGLDLNMHLVELSKENLVLDCSENQPLTKERISMLISDKADQDELEESRLDDDIVSIGNTLNADIENSFSTMISNAVSSRLPLEHVPQMEELLEDYKDIWRLQLGPHPPVKVDPMMIRLKENSVPVMCKARRYPPNHRDYMKKHVAELL
jgi:hypothetical protein